MTTAPDNSYPALSIEPVDQHSSTQKIWMDVIKNAPQAWYRHTHNLAEFHRAVAIDKNLDERSVFIKENEKIIGLIPIMIINGPNDTREISYNGSPSPWPCFLTTAENDIKTCEAFAFDYLENLCADQKVDRCIMGLNTPLLTTENHQESINRIAKQYKFTDESFPSHLVNIDEESPNRMRASYRRNVRKFSKIYEAKTYQGKEVTEEIEQAYFELHVKDAGGQFRSRNSYTKMADLARNNEAIFIVARNRENQKVVGILIIATFKNAAYDVSVSIDPDHHQDYISHILKVEALRHLNEQGITHYELGRICSNPSSNFITTQKERSISFFKDGFSRGDQKTSYVLEKYFTKHALSAKRNNETQNLMTYFEINP